MIETHVTTNPELVNKINNLISKYKFAGKTSISWSALQDGVYLDNNKLEKIIIEAMGSNPFKDELRPDPKRFPTLNKAVWLRENLLMLEFVYIDKPYLLEVDYDYQEIWPTRRASVLIRPYDTSFAIESRANLQQSRNLHKIVSDMLGVQANILDFSDDEIERLKLNLSAKKKAAKHKKSGGDFDTMEVTAAPTIDDLDESQEYLDSLSADELSKARYKFTYHDSDGGHLDVTIYISNKGSIWFVSEVPEEVIDHVFSSIRRVKRI